MRKMTKKNDKYRNVGGNKRVETNELNLTAASVSPSPLMKQSIFIQRVPEKDLTLGFQVVNRHFERRLNK